MLGKIKKLPKEVILLIVVVIVVLVCFFVNKGITNKTELNSNENKNTNVENSENSNPSINVNDAVTFTEEGIDENHIKIIASDGITWIYEKNDDGEIVKTTHSDGTEEYYWEYYEEKFKQTESDTREQSMAIAMWSSSKAANVAKEIKIAYEDLKNKNKDEYVNQYLDLYSKAITLTIAEDNADTELYKVGQYTRDYILSKFGGYKGLKEPEEIKENLEELLENY